MPKSEIFEKIARSSNTTDHHTCKKLATDPASRTRDPVTSWADAREGEVPRLTTATMDAISNVPLVLPTTDLQIGDPVLLRRESGVPGPQPTAIRGMNRVLEVLARPTNELRVDRIRIKIALPMSRLRIRELRIRLRINRLRPL